MIDAETIEAAMHRSKNNRFKKWARLWLDGTDRSRKSAVHTLYSVGRYTIEHEVLWEVLTKLK